VSSLESRETEKGERQEELAAEERKREMMERERGER